MLCPTMFMFTVKAIPNSCLLFSVPLWKLRSGPSSMFTYVVTYCMVLLVHPDLYQLNTFHIPKFLFHVRCLRRILWSLIFPGLSFCFIPCYFRCGVVAPYYEPASFIWVSDRNWYLLSSSIHPTTTRGPVDIYYCE